jgi:hypothetical protein
MEPLSVEAIAFEDRIEPGLQPLELARAADRITGHWIPVGVAG